LKRELSYRPDDSIWSISALERVPKKLIDFFDENLPGAKPGAVFLERLKAAAKAKRNLLLSPYLASARYKLPRLLSWAFSPVTGEHANSLK
jgi:hypothetical protein